MSFSASINLLVNSNVFEHLSSIFYALSLLTLIGLFVFGKKINGALSWYLIGGFSFQPSEFAKITTAILVSKTLSSIQIDLNKISDLIKIIISIGVPVVLIFLQPDAGSGIVFFGLIFVLLREGLDIKVLYLVLLLAFLFILSLLFNPIGLCIAILIVILLVYRLIVRTYPKTNKKPFILVFVISSLFIFQ